MVDGASYTLSLQSGSSNAGNWKSSSFSTGSGYHIPTNIPITFSIDAERTTLHLPHQVEHIPILLLDTTPHTAKAPALPITPLDLLQLPSLPLVRPLQPLLHLPLEKPQQATPQQDKTQLLLVNKALATLIAAALTAVPTRMELHLAPYPLLVLLLILLPLLAVRLLLHLICIMVLICVL